MILRAYKTEIGVSCENELVEDILSLMASFSAKIYGRRSSQNLKQIYRESSSRIDASGDGSSSNASLVSPSLNEEFNKKSRVYILKV
jgi:tRNA A37 threonylcarbamoyladenosine synthetase subunit TsaC/SUA5/YrdC